ncbi:DUF5685 family protein [Marinitenerispora sediminis]|uniref:Regulator n=1 Tax=Marinitenerispora sediminis TaxID=1931232 RepID=A0A368SZ85_9ACTN|nr:DUF5685 family protein [Marinitenerispora sediminis]RCV48718.1 regulator [Marinitenerispora sediminis]RCV50603.1 regulator [Marinitenerispora sediminis]RCV50878.1 regulator [Marinitenerispora sediminis]
MFGILRPCRHTLPGDLATAWISHLCGMCLALRDDHGQLARVATNYDGLVVSALVAAQGAPGAGTRAAGPCPLRGMRRAEVARGDGARLAATVSLALASAKVADHVEDRDRGYAAPAVRGAARRVADRWARGAGRSGAELGLDGGALLAVVERQRAAEAATGPGGDIRAVTEPTELATARAFAHTAVLAGRPGNEAPLAEAGRLFGRIAHLLDAVEDQRADAASGAWNPVAATGTPVRQVRRLCDDAVLGVRLALDEAEFTDDRLVRALLAEELPRAVRRTFTAAGHPAGDASPPHPGAPGPAGGAGRRRSRRAEQDQGGCCCTCNCETPRIHRPPRRRGPVAGCAVAVFMCCTCQFCCRDPHPGPWSGKPHEGWCDPVAEMCDACGQTCDGCCSCARCCRSCECCDCGV